MNRPCDDDDDNFIAPPDKETPAVTSQLMLLYAKTGEVSDFACNLLRPSRQGIWTSYVYLFDFVS